MFIYVYNFKQIHTYYKHTRTHTHIYSCTAIGFNLAGHGPDSYAEQLLACTIDNSSSFKIMYSSFKCNMYLLVPMDACILNVLTDKCFNRFKYSQTVRLMHN